MRPHPNPLPDLGEGVNAGLPSGRTVGGTPPSERQNVPRYASLSLASSYPAIIRRRKEYREQQANLQKNFLSGGRFFYDYDSSADHRFFRNILDRT